jgi:hypothetical protein
MKLIEVVVLMGAHCISPIQSTEAVTEAAKVQCAAVVEKDAQQGTVRVIPAGAANHPQVVAVIDRFNAGLPPGTRIEPAYAPPGGSIPAGRRPVASAATLKQAPAPAPEPQFSEADTAPEQAEPAAPAEQQMAAVPEEKAEKPATAKTPAASRKKATAAVKKQKKTSAKSGSQCSGSAVPKWYTTDDGRKKYRCVKPTASKSPPQTIEALR